MPDAVRPPDGLDGVDGPGRVLRADGGPRELEGGVGQGGRGGTEGAEVSVDPHPAAAGRPGAGVRRGGAGVHARHGGAPPPLLGEGRGPDVFGNVQLRIHQVSETGEIRTCHGERASAFLIPSLSAAWAVC